MMNDKELADKLESFGAEQCGNDYRWIDVGVIDSLPADEFVIDWRVAGALMEKVDAHFIERLNGRVWAVRSDKPCGEGKTRDWYENESLPNAIITACVEALS